MLDALERDLTLDFPQVLFPAVQCILRAQRAEHFLGVGTGHQMLGLQVGQLFVIEA